MYDLLIKGGLVADGTGDTPPFRADLAVAGQRIVKLAPDIREAAAKTIDASGMIVSPGFIDVHTHDDIVFDRDPLNEPKLRQGVTTVIVGNCGFGVAPAASACRRDLIDYNTPILGEETKELLFDTFGEYLAHMDSIPKALNVAALVPHGAVYMSANGFRDQPMEAQELDKACGYVREAMEAGAVGLSFGLMYAPGCYSPQTEIEALAGEVGAAGGVVTVHMKSESDHFRESVMAAAELSRKCRAAVEISHLKNVGKEYWGNMSGVLNWLRDTLREGADLSFDMYPYTMGSTTMAILFPTEYMKTGVRPLLESLKNPAIRGAISKRLKESWGDEDNLSLLCGWENVIISSVKTEKNRYCLGKSVGELAVRRQQAEDEAFMTLFMEEDGEVSVLLNHIAEKDMEDTLLFERVSVASDGLPGAKAPHPRLYGTFPKYLREFVREKKLLTWEKAIHKITGQPAKRFHLGERGILREGWFADITIFDPDAICDTATFDRPVSYPIGISHVIVNGRPVLQDGAAGEAREGILIRRAIK